MTLKSQIEQAKERFTKKFVPYEPLNGLQVDSGNRKYFDDFLATEITAVIEEYKKAVKVEKIDLIKQGYKISHEQFAKSWNDALSEIEAKDREWREGK